MKNDDIKQLALDLLHADSEVEVVEILKSKELWDDPSLWRLYGDKEGNFAQTGNQQSLPEAALVEKIVNSVDARLMNECLLSEIAPESEAAPVNVRDAVAMFFENKRSTDDQSGTLINWAKAKRTEQSRLITISATGDHPTKGRKSRNMCLTIVDQGEGQSAQRLPRTILSLNAKNKQRIRFVQGKFNMGGSGALRFCGENGIQLVISRRNPELFKDNGTNDLTLDKWCLTIVRREEPSNKSGEPVHSEFTYLAPVGAAKNPRSGEVLSFASENLPLMPEGNSAYEKEVGWATAIKLYEYETKCGQSNIIWPDGLLYSLERLLPEIALPIRLHECRDKYKGKGGSFDTPLAGLVVRLEDGKGGNLEINPPISSPLVVRGMNMTARIYVFREDKAATYLRDEGVIFSINGQSHGHLSKSIFSRPKAVGLPRLKDSMLVLIDCSKLTARQREDLFMTSRDRLSEKPIRHEVEAEIETLLRENSILKELQQQRRLKDVESKLQDEKPLEEVLNKVLKSSPTLSSLFMKGQRLTRPFSKGGGDSNEGPGGSGKTNEKYIGKRHPTFFKFEKVQYGKTLIRNCEKGRRVRLTFVTDVENEYFDRATDKGFFELEPIGVSSDLTCPNYSASPENGIVHLNMSLPDGATVEDKFTFQATVSDPTLVEPFVNVFELTVVGKNQRDGSENTSKKHRGGGKGKNPSTHGISIPRVIPVKEGDQNWLKYGFSHNTATHVISDPIIDEEGETHLNHVFYINMDNNSLKNEMKYTKQDPRLLEGKFKYGNVLLGLAIIHDSENNTADSRNSDSNKDLHKDNEKELPAEEQISKVTEAVAPVLIPMIDELSGLQEEHLKQLDD